jgi:hypothetical protein
MEKLDKVCLFTIAKQLKTKDLLYFCLSSKKIYNSIWNSMIWKYKIEKEYPKEKTTLDIIGYKNLYLQNLTCQYNYSRGIKKGTYCNLKTFYTGEKGSQHFCYNHFKFIQNSRQLKMIYLK